MAGPELAKDKTGVRLQVAHHKSDAQDATKTGLSSFELDGSSAAATSSAFAYNTAVKVASTTATGTAMNFVQYDTDLSVLAGNSCEISLAVTDDATVSAAVSLTFA